MANGTRSSGRRMKDTANDNSPSASGSDTSGLRRSARETPSKKQRSSSSPLSRRKSERIEKRTPSTSTSTSTPSVPSPLKLKTDISNKDQRPVRIVLAKKRLNARSYRNSLLTPEATNTQESDLGDQTCKRDSDHLGASNSKDVPESIVNNGEEVGGPCSGLRKLDVGGTKNIKIHSDDSHQSNNKDNSPVANCSTDSLQPFPQISAKQMASDTDKAQVYCSARDNFLKVSMISALEGRSISDDQHGLENACAAGDSKRKRKSEKLDSDASMTEANEEIYPSADCVTLLPSKNKRSSFLGCCDACSKRQRFEVDSQKCNICSCNKGENRDSRNISSSEDGSEIRSSVCIGLNEGCDDKVQLKESPLETQTEYDHNVCFICKLHGKLLCCNGKGCKRNYHIYCLDPPLKAVPLEGWHCFQCIKRKIQFGVHSVSEGIESICDVRDEEVPDCEGIQRQKQYLVKYKGLAHVHNRWIPEHQLVLEVPSPVARFKKNQVPKWKSEWTKPERLVQRRSLVSPNQQDENCSDCQYEWFVKWSGLGYEHATWELENAPFLRSSEATTLIRDYESRLEKAIWASNPSREKLLEERKCTSFKLSKLPSGNVSGLDNDHLNFVNKLREYWHNNQNVAVEDQERISKIVLFILSMQSDVCRPFLIISTSYAISAWEAEFLSAAPSVNVVAYNGDKVVRESIRALEFYEDRGCVMLQVLLSPIDAIIEDIEALELIGWEAIIVDECQRSIISKHFERVKKLPNGFRLLLLSGPIKESMTEYLNLLSFVESDGERNGDVSLKVDSSDTIGKLKERFARFVACDQKSDSSKFVEYWVPVCLSSVQLEQYCATLLSNSISLCSCSKNDPVGALRDILISVRKCCDHPYLVDQSLQSLLTKDLAEVEYLDVGIKASGKLQVLDQILSEIKTRGLRVLILFQSIGGSGRNHIGDILDDFLRQRFGPDSYERVDSGLVTSKKQVALNMFNNRERGRFVFLIENRACLPSIKLSAVDMAIVFDSDWNPLNDLRALQKITIDSQFEQLKVFRLYSSCTVEEKVLNLAKHDKTLESNIQNINRGTSHMLLLWGAHFLFQKLDEFHSSSTPSSGSNIVSVQSFLYDVVQEWLSQLPNNAEINETKICKIVLKAQQSGGSYSKDIILLGEKEMQSRDEELPHVVWTNVLNGRYPRWRYASEPSPRIRRKVQYFDESQKKSQGNDEGVKKRKKVLSNTIDPNTPKSFLDNKRKLVSMDEEGASGTPTCNGSQNLLPSMANTNSANHPVLNQPETPMIESNESRNLLDSQKHLHFSLKPVILKLCEILQLPDNVKSMSGKFLEYIMHNHSVSTEPATIFQAFQISLCWSAASLVKYKMSHTKSLSLATQHLNFQCKGEETDLIYSKLRMLRKMFSSQSKSIEPNAAEKSSPRDKGKHRLHIKSSQSILYALQELEDGEIRKSPKSSKCPIQVDSSKQKLATDFENASGSSKYGSSNSIKEVLKTHRRRMRKLYKKQLEEFDKFNKNKENILEKENADLELKHKLESALIRNLNSQLSVRLEKLKMLDQDFARKKEELNTRMETEQRKLEAMQRKIRNEEKKMKAHWLDEAKSERSVATYATLPLSDSGFGVENMDELVQVVYSHENSGSMFSLEDVKDCEQGGVGTTSSQSSLERQYTNGVVSVLPAESVPVEIFATDPDEDEVLQIVATGPAPLALQSGGMGVEVETLVSESATDTRSMQQRRLCRPDSGSPSLGQTLLDHPLNQEHPTPSHAGQVPPLQVPDDGHAQPSATPAEWQPVGVSFGIEIHTTRPADALPVNQVNDDTPVMPPAVQLELSPSADPPSTEHSLPDTSACSWLVQEQINESLQQLEAPTQAPGENQHVISDPSGPLPNNQFSHAGSQQTHVPVASVDPHSTLQSQPEVTASTCIASEQRNERHTSLQQFEAQIESPVEDQHVIIDHFDPPPENQSSHAASQQDQVPAPLADPPSTEQSQPEVPASTSIDREQRNERDTSLQQFEAQLQSPGEDQDVIVDHSHPLPDYQFSHAASQQSQVPALLADPHATERSQPEVPASACIDQEQRDERHNPFQQLEAQIRAPMDDQSELLNHSDLLQENQFRNTAAQQTQVPAVLPIMEQMEELNHSASRPNAQSQVHPSTESSMSGSGSRLLDTRSVSLVRDFSPRPPHISPVPSWSAPQLCPDPLQNELGRIHREEEQDVKMHEDEKIRLNSECERELEEIRKKYNTMIQNVESEFMQRKKQREINYHIVFMNRNLAEAFRLKCDARTVGAPGLQQGTPCGSMQQAFRLPSPQVAQRPAPGPLTAPPAAPPVQTVHQPSALFSNNPIRSPFSHALSPSGNHPVGRLAPPPHLQPVRPLTSMAASSLSPLSCMLPGQQSVNNPTTTSSVHSQRTPRLPTHLSGPFSRGHQPENLGGSRGCHNSSLLGLELLMDIEKRPTINPQTLLSPLQDVGQNIDTWNTPELRITGTLRVPAVCVGSAADIVCLSDDD